MTLPPPLGPLLERRVAFPMSTPTSALARASFSLAVSLLLASSAAAQAGAGGLPPSRRLALASEVPVEGMPAVDFARLLAEDESNPGEAVPLRFGLGHDVSLGLQNAGAWEDLPGGELLWRLGIRSSGARSINLIFDRFALPPGAELYVHNAAGRVLGAFTSEHNRDHGMFATEPLAGDALTLEYRVPRGAPLGELRLGQVIHAYRDVLGTDARAAAAGTGPTGAGGTKASGACNININCPLGASWQNDKRSSARLIMGGVLCSGALVNNTAGDQKQYFLTANHCYSGNPATWVFQFNYESPTCNGTNGVPQSVTGSVLRTKNGTADHCLVEITQPIPSSYNVYYSGWSRLTSGSTTSTGIHHPLGDIKKICQDTNTAVSTTVNGVLVWWVQSWEFGVTEGGSSGSPLYDQSHRIVGQLWGGQASCSFLFNDYYGRFGVAWNNGLAGWLDPLGSNQMTLDGTYGSGGQPTVYCTPKLNSQGLPPSIGYSGVPSLAQNNLVLSCANGIPSTPCLVFWGNGQNSSPFLGGTLCVLPPLIREPVQQFDLFGNVDTPVAITAGMVGTVRYYQYWGRDPAHPDGTSTLLSDALQVPFSN